MRAGPMRAGRMGPGRRFAAERLGKLCAGLGTEGGHVKKARTRLAAGRADPFGLLVLVVLFALSVTIGIQAQVSGTVGSRPLLPLTVFTVGASATHTASG